MKYKIVRLPHVVDGDILDLPKDVIIIKTEFFRWGRYNPESHYSITYLKPIYPEEEMKIIKERDITLIKPLPGLKDGTEKVKKFKLFGRKRKCLSK